MDGWTPNIGLIIIHELFEEQNSDKEYLDPISLTTGYLFMSKEQKRFQTIYQN